MCKSARSGGRGNCAKPQEVEEEETSDFPTTGDLVVLLWKGLFEVDVELGVFVVSKLCVTVAVLSPWLWLSIQFPAHLSSVSLLIVMVAIEGCEYDRQGLAMKAKKKKKLPETFFQFWYQVGKQNLLLISLKN